MLGDPNRHHGSHSDASAAPPAQQVLDTAFAWACLNHRFEIAEFMLTHGANINTTWNTHEAASVLYLAAMSGDYALARFLIDRDIDMTIQDHRWGGTAEGGRTPLGRIEGCTSFSRGRSESATMINVWTNRLPSEAHRARTRCRARFSMCQEVGPAVGGIGYSLGIPPDALQRTDGLADVLPF